MTLPTILEFQTKAMCLRQDPPRWQHYINEVFKAAWAAENYELKRAAEDEFELYLWRHDKYAY